MLIYRLILQTCPAALILVQSTVLLVACNQALSLAESTRSRAKEFVQVEKGKKLAKKKSMRPDEWAGMKGEAVREGGQAAGDGWGVDAEAVKE